MPKLPILAAACLLAGVTPVVAQVPGCPTPADLAPAAAKGLERSRAALAPGGALRVVAIGSSSTEGAGRPAQLDAILEPRHAGAAVGG